MKYGDAIKRLRNARGLTQEEVATAASFDASYVSMVERGRRIPSGTALESLAKALDVPLYLLMLLASEDEDLRGVPRREAHQLGAALLNVLNGRREKRKK